MKTKTITAASTLAAAKVGDLVFSDYGAMCGDDFGTVMGFETSQWGTTMWVRNSDFTLSPVSTLSGTVTVKHGVDYEGNPYMSARPLTGKGIGVYLVVN